MPITDQRFNKCVYNFSSAPTEHFPRIFTKFCLYRPDGFARSISNAHVRSAFTTAPDAETAKVFLLTVDKYVASVARHLTARFAL